MIFRIVEDRLGEAYACADDDDVLLRAALRAGLPVPYECNVGGCGSCKFDLLEGEVADQWPDAPALGERDRQRGRRLACQARPLGDCRIRFIGRRAREDAPAPRRMAAVLTEVNDVTHDMRQFRFHAEGPAHFRPGQYALLSLPEVMGSRAYSMSNLDNCQGTWEFIVRRVPNGRMTSALFDLRPGDGVGLDGPYGHAWLRPEAGRDVVCIAGGSGLAPMISISRGLDRHEDGAVRQLDFVYGGRSADDICGETLLRALPRLGSRLRFHPIVSGGDARWPGATGLVHELVASLPAGTLAAADFYLAGPPAMAEAVLGVLTKINAVPAARIRYDRFF